MVVHAARVWDGESDDVTENVDLIVEGNRIASVVPHSDANHEAGAANGAEVVDAGDHTVLPGLVDMHSHMGYGMGEALGRTFLAYGVTTIRDPTSDPYEIAERRESIDSGRRIGPREFATGRTMDGNRIYYSGAGSLGPNGNLELELDRAEHTALLAHQDLRPPAGPHPAPDHRLRPFHRDPRFEPRDLPRRRARCGPRRTHLGHEPPRLLAQGDGDVPYL